MQEKGFFARLAGLWRGVFGKRLRHAEARNAEAVYDNAIRERANHHDQLKDAVGQLVYLRNRITAKRQQCERDLETVRTALHKAAAADRDNEALELMRKERQLQHDLERLRGDEQRLEQQGTTAKQSLTEVSKSIRQLKEEREEMVARKAHASARLQAEQLVERATQVEMAGVDSALENVRESIFRLEGRAGVNDAMGAPEASADAELSIEALRERNAREQDAEDLAALKRKLNGRLLPEGQKQPFEPRDRAASEVVQ